MTSDLFKNMINAEFNAIEEADNPDISDDTQFLWVLSSRHTVQLQHINCPEMPQNYVPNPIHPSASAEKECDVEDDLMRLTAAIQIAQALIAKRANKPIKKLRRSDYLKYGPFIIYNGWPEQNQALNQTLNDIHSIIPYYPKSKYIIFEMPNNNQNTIGQFISLNEQIRKNSLLTPLQNPRTPLTIVTSAYHAPRTQRYFKTPIYGDQLNHLKNITFHLIDRKGERPCIKRDLQGEKDRIVLYTKKGWLGKPKKVFINKAIEQTTSKAWTPYRDTKQQIISNPVTPIAIHPKAASFRYIR